MQCRSGNRAFRPPLDFETGIVFEKKVGESVEIGEIVAKVYANEKISQELVTEFKKNVKISNEPKKVQEIIEVIA